MTELKTQYGIASEADFEKGTWTFKMNGNFEVTAGSYAIVQEDLYQELLSTLKSMMLSIGAHPDCSDGSEFYDMVDSAEEIYLKLTGKNII